MCIDGSAERKACAELSRAAWAVVVIGEAGNLEGYVRGPVWASVGKHTSGAAELVALAAAVDLADGSNTVATDYLTTVKV